MENNAEGGRGEASEQEPQEVGAGIQDGILCGVSPEYLEHIYHEVGNGGGGDPKVDAQWRSYFEEIEKSAPDFGVAAAANNGSGHASVQRSAANSSKVSSPDFIFSDPELGVVASDMGANSSELGDQETKDSAQAIMMIRAYRARGHLLANLDPLALKSRTLPPELNPDNYGFDEHRRDHPVYIAGMLGMDSASINDVLRILTRTYCASIGYEFMHVSGPEEKRWLQLRFEGKGKEVRLEKSEQLELLTQLIEAEGFEHFCQLKFTGTKRFGLDGSEAIIPALEQIIDRGSELGLEEAVIGMPHRGRLNVLTAVMGKPYRAVFSEFQGSDVEDVADLEGSGDVKYHLGASSDREYLGNKVHLSLTANPSHLEIVDPVVMGKARAKQDQRSDRVHRSKVLPLLLHGDAAFAGQGVVAECFGLSGLRGHRVGGTIHLIVNNQIGFTTNPRYARSSPYPSDVAKMVEAPIIHVNGDDPEAVIYSTRIAIEYRQKFGKPVVIDMFCYRRYGHNEGDEPMFTQPMMYRKIAKHPSVVEIYTKKLLAEGVISEAELREIRDNFRQKLETELMAASDYRVDKADWFDGKWQGLRSVRQDDAASTNRDRRGKTTFDALELKRLSKVIHSEPAGIEVHKTLRRVMKQRRESVDSGINIDWATAESLAFASLLSEGTPVRLSGQDSERGTFSQRHAVIYDQGTETRYVPLEHVAKEGGTTFEVINSMLSEEAVMGFEYGYTLAEPDALTMWEAQFGDFANGAQVVIDQFISSGQHKWLRNSGIVLLLPHGYEGQGPEHSSARLERYLQLCAEDNLQVANCTTPANYFHVLRRQQRRQFRIPLILMTPKSLLRHRGCVSTLEELSNGSVFHRVLHDDRMVDGALKVGNKAIALDAVKRVVLCSGKVYYDLLNERDDRGIDDVYLLRVEQLYPFPKNSISVELASMPNAEIVWAQEEPENMGAWRFVQPLMSSIMANASRDQLSPRYAGRDESASTATGLLSVHKAELQNIFDAVFS